VQPTTAAIRPSVSNVRRVNRSSKLFNCERKEPICTVIKVYGAMPKQRKNNLFQKKLFFFLDKPKRIEKKKIFFGTYNNGHVSVISAFGLIGTIRIKSKTKNRLSRPASTF
jgi:hypothetical protein